MIYGNPSIYDRQDYVVLDLEYNGHPRDADGKIVCGVALQEGHYEIFEGGSVGEARLARKIAAAPFVVAHNAKADCGWLKRIGVDLRKLVIYDTMLGEWVLQAGLPPKEGQLSLEGTAARRSCGVKDEWVTMLFSLYAASDIPYSSTLKHCINDVAMTDSIFKLQLLELKAKELLGIQYSRCMVPPMLADMESRPLMLDKEAVDREYTKAVAERNTLSEKMYTLTGGINVNSPDQLGVYLFDVLGFESTTKTAGGKRSTAQDVLNKLSAKTPAQKEFLNLFQEYNELDSRISKNLELFHGLCDENNCEMFVEIRQGTVVTHRFSSNGVPFKHSTWDKSKKAQGQNIPRDMKRLYKAPEGYDVGEVDGSALEFRIAASMSGDAVALEEISNLFDIHSGSAAAYNCSRQDAKEKTFRPLYGATGGSPLDKKYQKFFREKYKGINQMQERWVADALVDKQFRSPFGIIYHFPDIRIEGYGYVNRKRDIYNFPIQGGATGEVIPISMCLMWHRLGELSLDEDIQMVLQVHDSIKSWVRHGSEDKWRDISIWAMTVGVREFLNRVYCYDLGDVELGIGAKIGPRWGVGDERSFQTTKAGVVYEVIKGASGKEKVLYSTGGDTLGRE